MTTLAQASDIQATPLWEIVQRYPQVNLNALLAQASGAVEDYCNVRLAPFTGLVETARATALDTEEAWDMFTPLDQNSALAFSRAQSLGSSQLVRHHWVRNRPPTRNDLWQGSIQDITILRAISGSQDITAGVMSNAIQYEQDTGHIRFYFGSFIPPGSTFVVTYSGGYNPVPASLVLATCFKAAIIAITTLQPEQNKGALDIDILKQEFAELCSPFVLDGDG